MSDYYSDFLRPTADSAANARQINPLSDANLPFHTEIASVIFDGPSQFQREARETEAVKKFFTWIRGPVKDDVTALSNGLRKIDQFLFPKISGSKRLEIVRTVEKINPLLLECMPHALAMKNHLEVAREQAITFNPNTLSNLAAALKKERFSS